MPSIDSSAHGTPASRLKRRPFGNRKRCQWIQVPRIHRAKHVIIRAVRRYRFRDPCATR